MTCVGEQVTDLVRKVNLFESHLVEVMGGVYWDAVVEEWHGCFIKHKSEKLHGLLNEIAPDLQTGSTSSTTSP